VAGPDRRCFGSAVVNQQRQDDPAQHLPLCVLPGARRANFSRFETARLSSSFASVTVRGSRTRPRSNDRRQRPIHDAAIWWIDVPRMRGRPSPDRRQVKMVRGFIDQAAAIEHTGMTGSIERPLACQQETRECSGPYRDAGGLMAGLRRLPVRRGHSCRQIPRKRTETWWFTLSGCVMGAPK